jgi:predicted DNA-binding ribbon-helix-helix protein
MFWAALERAAAEADKPINSIIAEVDAARLESRPIPNLTSAIRQWLFAQALRR